MDKPIIEIYGLKKKYRLGSIGGGTLTGDIQSWWARKHGKEDPNAKVGEGMSRNEDFWALKGIDLCANKGEALGIIGINGAGKSTLLKILSRVTAPTDGEIIIRGKLTSMLEVGTGFHGELTGRQNVYLNGAILGMKREEIDERMDDIIDFSEVGKFIDTPVKRYSSGMYVKLAFSVAAHLNSDIMIMDEVLAVGDVNFQKKCLQKMRELVETEGRTVLYVSHNMATIRQLCSRCIVLEKGTLLYDGDVETAIMKYAVEEDSEIKEEVDLTVKRRSPNSLRTIEMQRVQILNMIDGHLDGTQRLRIQLQWQLKTDFSGQAQVMFTFSDERDTRFASSVSENVFDDLLVGKTYINIFEIDVSMLEEGKYYCYITFFEVSPLGSREIVLDHTIKSFSFIILKPLRKNNNLIWLGRPYGAIRLDDATVK